MKTLAALLCLLLILSCSGDDFTADCGTWGEFRECRELSDTELELYNEVRECMGVTEELPSPTVVIVSGRSISCGDVLSSGCQIGGFVGFPETASNALLSPVIWKHEFTHEILELTAGHADRKHSTVWFETQECIRE